MIEIRRNLFWRVVLALTIVLSIASMFQMAGIANTYHIDILHSTWTLVLLAIAGCVLAEAILLVLLFSGWQNRLLELAEKVTQLSKNWRILASCVFILLLPIYSVITLHPYLRRYYTAGLWTHMALFWGLALAGMACLKITRKELSWFTALWLEVLIGSVFALIVRQFLTVTNYPFALTWSEAARFYGASLFFSKKIYNASIPLGIMHPTWHFLLALPFLVKQLPIWTHRLWWALLQLILGIATSWWLVKRFKAGGRTMAWVATGWVLLFLFPRPILVHLLFCTLIVLWGVKADNFRRTTLIVVLASIWAGLSRINWFPVPGIFAAVVYLFEIPYDQRSKMSRYLWKPILWVLSGSLIALGSNFLYISATGNGAGGNFSSSLTSALLWYRLMPSATYRQGVLPDLILLTGPVILALLLSRKSWKNGLHPIRLLGIAASLAVLLAGGLVVSVKIGGGSDLHNLDAFLILLTITSGYLLFGNYAQDETVEKARILHNPLVLSLLLITPVWMILRVNASLFVWDKTQTEQTLNLIHQTVEDISDQGGKVLFISQRQLEALQMVDVPLVPDYEQDFLMEMVMSHNQAYLARFQEDLQAQRFGAIVLDAQTVNLHGKTRSFGEEGDLWVQEVSIPLLCYYETPPAFADSSIVVYTPRSQPCK